MAEPIVSTLSIPFTAEDGLGDNAGKNKIVLQQMTKRLDYQGRLWARCFPSRGVRFTASVGTVEPGEVRSQVIYESLKFSNSATASLKFPGVAAVTITPYVSMKVSKDNYGHKTITPASVSFHYDADQEQVMVTSGGKEQPIYGACSVSYAVFYQILYYTPRTSAIPVGGADYSFSYGIGTIFGYNDYTVETLDMELELSNTPDWVEYARVTSKIVLDAKGTWEYPPNWDSTYAANKNKSPDQRSDYTMGKFSGYSYEIDPDNSFTDTRLHCIVQVNTIGTLRFEDHANGGSGYWTWFDPYFGSSGWNPKYEIVFAEPPGGSKANSAEDFKHDLMYETWRDVFLSVDKAEVEARLKVDYPGATSSK